MNINPSHDPLDENPILPDLQEEHQGKLKEDGQSIQRDNQRLLDVPPDSCWPFSVQWRATLPTKLEERAGHSGKFGADKGKLLALSYRVRWRDFEDKRE